MKVDFTIKPEFTAMAKWERATVRINTKKGAEAYNEYFGTERRMGDTFTMSNNSWKEFEMMRESYNLSSVFG